MKRGLSLLAGLALLLSCPGLSWGQGATIQMAMHIYAGPLYREYLGCLNCDQFDPASVWDGYGAMGWDNSFTASSHFARYRSPHGRYSACDAYAAEPPILKDNSLRQYGVLNVSNTRADSICGPHGVPAICKILKETCARGDVP
jgi:hypothetical protein